MPKMKTKKAASKRFSLTASGKVKYKKNEPSPYPLPRKRKEAKEKSEKGGLRGPAPSTRSRRSFCPTAKLGSIGE
jgi:large subunit ribosomal protein L35